MSLLGIKVLFSWITFACLLNVERTGWLKTESHSAQIYLHPNLNLSIRDYHLSFTATCLRHRLWEWGGSLSAFSLRPGSHDRTSELGCDVAFANCSRTEGTSVSLTAEYRHAPHWCLSKHSPVRDLLLPRFIEKFLVLSGKKNVTERALC